MEKVQKLKKNVSKSLSFFMHASEHRISQEDLARQQEIEMGLLRDRELTLERDLASMMKKSANVKAQNASLPWNRGNIDEKIKVLWKDVGVAFKVVIKSAH